MLAESDRKGYFRDWIITRLNSHPRPSVIFCSDRSIRRRTNFNPDDSLLSFFHSPWIRIRLPVTFLSPGVRLPVDVFHFPNTYLEFRRFPVRLAYSTGIGTARWSIRDMFTRRGWSYYALKSFFLFFITCDISIPAVIEASNRKRRSIRLLEMNLILCHVCIVTVQI